MPEPVVAAGPTLITETDHFERSELEDGIGLCLSGGGYRAMVFHVGALVRLNEAGLLRKLNRISSVSGGSLTAGILGLHWKNLRFNTHGVAENIDEHLIIPVRKVASTNIDVGATLTGLVLPGITVGDRIAKAYAELVFGSATLQDLPDDSATAAPDKRGPRFVFNATSVQTGSLWRFSRPFMADYKVGVIPHPKLALARVVAASSAFPPVLSPVDIDVDPDDFDHSQDGPLAKPPYNDTLVLSDGGVYDNLGLETVWKRFKTVLVSNGGAPFETEEDPARDWGRHMYRILNLIDHQVRSLRVREVMAAFRNKLDEHKGTYWGITTNIADYQLADALACDFGATTTLAQTPTRLQRLPKRTQNRLMNWGYAVCDAALRCYCKDLLPAGFPAPAKFPFDDGVANPTCSCGKGPS